jgi:hypothetical protein
VPVPVPVPEMHHPVHRSSVTMAYVK